MCSLPPWWRPCLGHNDSSSLFFVVMKLSGSRTATTGHESFAPGIPTPLRSLGAMLLHGD